MINLKTSITIIVSLFFSSALYAENTFNNNFDKGKKTSNQLKQQSIEALKANNPKIYIKNYTNKPTEYQYVANPEIMSNDAIKYVKGQRAAQTVNESISNHPQFDIKPNSTMIKNITSRSEQIYAVIKGQFGDCTTKKECVTEYQTVTCEESPRSTYQYCKKTLYIDLVPKEKKTVYSLKIHIETKEHYYAGAVINSVDGRISHKGPHDASAFLNGRLPTHLDCHGLQGKVVKVTSKNPLTKIDYIGFPSCTNKNIDFHVTNQNRTGIVNVDIDIEITVTTTVLIPQDRWQDGCSGLESSTQCSFKQTRCLEENTVHDIQGIAINRPCWEQEITYQCGNGNTVSTCQVYRDQGCEQIHSICQNREDAYCSLYTQTLRCAQKKCTDVGLICNGETYCIDGDCVEKQKKPDPDFQKTISALSTVYAAAQGIMAGNYSVYTGTHKTCDKLALGILDCCANKGWGKDHILQCSQEEIDLKKAKENLLTVYIGEYCKKDPLGICIERRKSYCVFPSLLARIVQEQGRQDQLAIGFGDPEQPTCRGLTVDEFSKLDLSKMDFSDYYAEIAKKRKIENPAEANKRISDRVNQWAEGVTHG
ncbi:MAG TPA: conjugal transfer protein TraN [Gammaproteobacteria bacterium]|jgi:conjugal transfer mating pair stabilization protein TraN|nr:conjugal transfer protein TraN [Gammaproteobacteria bacterium]